MFAAAWAIAAWIRPEADYVAFPVLVAMAFPVSYRLALGPLPTPLAVGAAAAGAINTIVIALLLEVTGILGGPDLLPSLNAVIQATVLGLSGALFGAGIAVWGR